MTTKLIKPSHGPVKVYHDRASPHKRVRDGQRNPPVESRATQTDDSLLDQLIQERLRERSEGDGHPSADKGEKRDHTSVDTGEDEAYELMIKGAFRQCRLETVGVLTSREVSLNQCGSV